MKFARSPRTHPEHYYYYYTSPMYASPEYAPVQYAYPPVYEEAAPESSDSSDMAMLAVAGAVVGALIGWQKGGE